MYASLSQAVRRRMQNEMRRMPEIGLEALRTLHPTGPVHGLEIGSCVVQETCVCSAHSAPWRWGLNTEQLSASSPRIAQVEVNTSLHRLYSQKFFLPWSNVLCDLLKLSL
jgi:hypothetical protein